MTSQPGLKCREMLAALILTTFLLTTGVALGQKMPEASQGPSVAASFIRGNPEDYAGIDRCRSCHKPEFREYEKTAHAQVRVPGKRLHLRLRSLPRSREGARGRHRGRRRR